MKKFFGNKKSSKEKVSQHTVKLQENQTKLERSYYNLKKRENDVATELRNAIARGDKRGQVLLAKSLRDLRKQQTYTYQMKLQMGSIETDVMIEDGQSIVESSASTGTKVLNDVYDETKVRSRVRTVEKFSKASEKSETLKDISYEYMDRMHNETLDDEEDVDEIIKEQRDLYNIEVGERLSVVPVPSNEELGVKNKRKTKPDIEERMRKLNMDS